jgi:hypothetical protein
LLTTLLSSLLLTRIILARSAGRLLTMTLALVASTHVSLEIVVLHFVICHVRYPPICSMSPPEYQRSPVSLIAAHKLINTRANSARPF